MPALRLACSIVLVLVGLGSCGGCRSSASGREGTSEEAGTEGCVIGVVRQVGNAPHLDLVVTGSHEGDAARRDYYIVGDKARDAERFTGLLVEAYGVIRYDELRLAGASGKTRGRYIVNLARIIPKE